MKLRALITISMLAASVAAVAAAPAAPKSPIQVKHAWIRWLPANLPAAGYAVLRNDSGTSVRLTGASSPAYGSVTLHRSLVMQGRDKMVPISHLTIPAHGSVKLAPGGYHLMLTHATRSIKPGATVKITLKFSNQAALQTSFSVLPANSSGPTD
jgi:copper(I)-binding protein